MATVYRFLSDRGQDKRHHTDDRDRVLLTNTDLGGEVDQSAKATDNAVELMCRIAGGDKLALEALVKQHGDYIRRLVGCLTAWSPDVDDLQQEVLLRIWSKAHQFDSTSNMRPWLRKITVNICRNHHRSLRRYFELLRRFWNSIEYDNNRREPGRLEREQQHLGDKVQWAMEQLNYRDREVIVLAYFDQRPLDAIAKEIGIKVETLHVRLHRVRQRIATLLEQQESRNFREDD
jgi:RNA polymerase sigma-70 factor (ECF subfamily)